MVGAGTGTGIRRVGGMTRITPEKWLAVRAAVKDSGERFAQLVTAADPGAMATADWTVMDTAAHVTGIAWHNTAAVVSDDLPGPIEGMKEHILSTTVDNIHAGMNTVIFNNYKERDPQKVTERLRTSIDEALDLTADADPSRTITWLGGSRLPLAGVFAHLNNELLIHGRDIATARGVRAPWRIPQEHAALFFELFLIEIVRNGVGNVLDDDKPVYRGRIAVEFRSAYTDPVTIVLEHGELWIEEPGRDNDVRVYFEPATLNLVLFHRVSRPRAALTGSLRVWGRRPWLLGPFLRKVRLP